MDSEKWLKDMKFEIDFTSSNQVWTLVDPPKGVKPIGYKWVYKRRFGADGEEDVKMVFVNGFIEEEIYMDEPEGFTLAAVPQVLLVSPMAAKAPVTTRGKPRPRYCKITPLGSQGYSLNRMRSS
ncbi:hypothetical protein Sango_2438900 [Sesamum angolense]|uniref:Reverse transcriptase Ty1/copia-type domain-containing protein n=1 Tax=Sesamum angolense TaxID=2727404 RepID=A0AAE2BK44_9LAMI|nr:hypothetical protein Sango_2438900 [Sesamum angolense]